MDLYAFTQPDRSYQKVRTLVVGSDGTFSASVYPGGNTRAFVRAPGLADSPSDFVNVREVVSFQANRIGTRTYRFAGGVGPADGQTVSVYRTDGKGGLVLVGRAPLSTSNGGWTLKHTFGGTGTFQFFAVATKTQSNAAGSSPVIQVGIR
ncbi:MAG: hypothetical protein JWO22_731 [Frankiales bacterium]|nr:hypothetical protein [Frankiales bacterium]